ncbi:MAG: Gfo/Idh/MocA family oxidoreductase [Erysipelotrichaceae bacterium]|nr:Gfo/Idh/MocA family oxidoreductase [Erysipelotrichaceae bacterium]
MNKEIIRYGIISTASIAPRFARAMERTDNGRVMAVSSRSLDKAKAFAEEHDIPQFYDDYHKILEDPDIDAVYLPLVNSLHYPFARDALEAGKHVLVEKPFVLYPEQGEQLKELAAEKGLFLTEAIKAPFLPVLKEVKSIIDSGRFGPLYLMTFRQSYVRGRYNSGWNKQKKYGGGVLYGNEAYFMSIAEMMGGKFRHITGSPTYTVHDVEDQCALTAVMENNVLATSTVSTNVLLKNGLTLYLENARIEIPDYWKSREAFIYQNDELMETISIPCDYEMVYELQHYNECIQKGLLSSPVVTLESSIRYIELCRQLYDSWESMQQ